MVPDASILPITWSFSVGLVAPIPTFPSNTTLCLVSPTSASLLGDLNHVVNFPTPVPGIEPGSIEIVPSSPDIEA